MAETVKVRALKTFFAGGRQHRPGVVEVPAEKVARLVEKGFVAAPEGGTGDAASSPSATDERLEAAASRIGAALAVEREDGEPVADFLERVAGQIEKDATDSDAPGKQSSKKAKR
jgi:hypothetical protein